jgi:hypothetical protein
MRARIRLSFLLSCSLVLLLASVSPMHSQIHGVPASVTSFGFGGSNNPTPGVPASVTSLGPYGFGNGGDCCFVPFFSNRPPAFGERGDRRVHDHHQFPIGMSMPVYVPYAVSYPVAYNEPDTGDDESVDVDSTYSRGIPKAYDRGPWYWESAAHPAPRDPAPKAKGKATAPPSPPEAQEAQDPPEPVADQPTTVLIFKDGHKSEVQNYAIVGEKLFDFTNGRSRKIPLADLDLPATQKANEERGVDFQIPAKPTQVSQKK